ncbi:MAG: HlyD family secretion protein, partial [Burkholderiaceae bacterium]
FKEVQLRSMRIGQPVTLTADMYGGKVTYQGRVAGMGAGTGAAFALLPAQNATGNWIKVVQRVPVRIALEAGQVREHPLRVGLSMTATVDIRDQNGGSLAAAPRTDAAAQTRAFEVDTRAAESMVRRIIQANLVRRASAPASPGPAVPGGRALALGR